MDREEDDPVVADYDVFITPEMSEQLYILQYMNRPPDQPFTRATGCHPTELRYKEQSGFIEVDVPINIRQHYNRPMGVKWGEALRKTKGFGQKAYGIASGFERAMPRMNRPGAAADGPSAPAVAEEDDNVDEYVAHFEDANEKGHVLNTQTFGGQVVKDDGKGPNYMLGTFRENQLHLTRLHGLVQLRTQFHHIDATAHLDAVNRRREKESQEGAKPTEPKAFLPTVKKAGGDTSAELTQAFMKAANQEKWNKLQYSDEDSETAYEAYSERLFLENTSAAPKLHANMNNSQYLDAISAPSSGKGMKKKSAHKRHEDLVEISDESDAPEEEEEPRVS
ncbi:hypothetical protein BU26DRAFT_530916 [Trematosphaeria pertusa]|uniref:DNA-directed RNA polymerase III subunit Rpc5 n=1 Tax=Trematosphaeria pertusa TaxID=390896 RepID=A0A6A6IE49_9PLEO|nr:uncharacterized protein BU26DRAFT_530916 [Trematosphaeria pertusa]KAF2248854.1 hypothetical protein BU26DRAFT_530916 [Trematosphaeria pertusa]